ncbi:uncharacterized protein L201_003626 [Kwoniella dendrophila CBS 6074]|uniref:Uncharacterized protein n=1 Tax=Kwoniella dendrophila CBS 6074 TaxID=1295534 RepID=A0AAX4JV15_9TREE
MLRDPSSRPQAPFITSSPHAQFYSTPISAPSPQCITQKASIFNSYPTPPATTSNGLSQPTPIPSFTSQQQQQQQYQSYSVPPTPMINAPSSSSSRPTFRQSQSQQIPLISSSSSISRPKVLKKSSGSTTQKQKNVQMSLELKVEKAKGFHAFFVPLCKNLPPAPPCSPVNNHGTHGQTQTINQNTNSIDYFGGCWNKSKSNDQWVEDISNSLKNNNNHQQQTYNTNGDGMEVDTH